MPPFGIFASELLVISAGVAAHAWWPLGIGCAGLIVAFAALARVAIEIEAGAAPAASAGAPVTLYTRLATATAGLTLTCALALVALPWSSAARAPQAAADSIGAPR